MSESPPILELRGVTKSYPTPRGPVHVLKAVDLRLRPGELVALTGPSGSGKSTVINLVGLLDRPTSGTILFENRDVTSLDETELSAVRKHSIGMIFQKFCLLPHRSALENVEFRFRYLDVDRAEARRRAGQSLAAMGLSSVRDQPARLLSGGEMQRVAIARAIATRPRLLLADEPTGNLDRAASALVMEALRGLKEDGIGILLATHNEGLLSYCSRHLECRDGRLEERSP
jgi:ABC-type lipoprotein export system ATPase subunit